MLRKCNGNECLSKSHVFKWYKSFGNCREPVEEKPRSKRPLTSTNNEKIN